ncbi:MAG: glycoside hydrolase, partial [Bacteroidales bacterium]|nr:glycoside hydrolase [Bacteroidales bacterium]
MKSKILNLLMITLALNLTDCQKSKETNTSNLFYDIKSNFQNPETSSGVNCWWWWLNGNVNKAAITKDLEAMKSRNFQGAMVFDAGGHNQRGNRDIPAGPLFGSDEWNELFVFALDEAKRLGLEIGFNIQSGWNLGGPRVTPEYTAKQITFSEAKISGSKNVSLKLKLPNTRRDFYEDIAVLAFPIVEQQKTDETITYLDLKLGFHELGGSAPDTRFLLTNTLRNNATMPDNSSYIVKKDDILNLTSQMDADGNLNWQVPEGEWSVLRIGYTCTDSHVSTSSGEWQGSVLDYMSTEAFDFYWNDVVEPIFEAAGEHVGT